MRAGQLPEAPDGEARHSHGLRPCRPPAERQYRDPDHRGRGRGLGGGAVAEPVGRGQCRGGSQGGSEGRILRQPVAQHPLRHVRPHRGGVHGEALRRGLEHLGHPRQRLVTLARQFAQRSLQGELDLVPGAQQLHHPVRQGSAVPRRRSAVPLPLVHRRSPCRFPGTGSGRPLGARSGPPGTTRPRSASHTLADVSRTCARPGRSPLRRAARPLRPGRKHRPPCTAAPWPAARERCAARAPRRAGPSRGRGPAR